MTVDEFVYVQIHYSLRQMPNTFEFKTDTFAPQPKTVDKLFLYCYNKENYWKAGGQDDNDD